MGFREQFYPQTVGSMIQRYGEAKPDSNGNRLPITSGIASIGIIGALAPHVVRVLDDLQGQGSVPTAIRGAVFADYVNPDGTIKDLSMWTLLFNDASVRMSHKDFLAGVPDPVNPWKRGHLWGGGFYTIWIPSEVFGTEETARLNFARQMIREWQRAVDASAAGIRQSPNANDSFPPEYNAAFWLAVRQLCSSMDVLDENPPQDYFDKVKASVNYSIDQTATWAGKAAADVAGKVGEIAGNVAGGFFKEAGVTAIAVAGIALYLFVK